MENFIRTLNRSLILSTAFIAITTASAAALAASFGASTQISDGPHEVLRCQEVVGDAMVLDGGKLVMLSRDQFGQMTMTLIQHDAFSGDKALLVNQWLEPKACNGFTACELYTGQKARPQVTFQFFVNYLPHSPKPTAHFEYQTHGSGPTKAFDFLCQRS
jgi:hypothetical protein